MTLQEQLLQDPIHPFMQALTSSLDGKLCLWDIADGLLVKTFDVGKPIHALVRYPCLGVGAFCNWLLEKTATACIFQNMIQSIWCTFLSDGIIKPYEYGSTRECKTAFNGKPK